MQYRKYGNTGINISVLGFGAMRLPQKEVNGNMIYDHEESIRIMHRAFEGGVNYIDTAPNYCGYESEIIVGKALKGWRDKVYLSTKNEIEDASGEHYRKRLENSLRKLDADYIDFYHMWGIDWETYEKKIDVKDGPLIQAIKAKEEGLIKHISFSFHDKPENMIRLIDTGHFETVLCQYSMLDRSNEQAMAYACKKGLGVAVMGPVGGGSLGAPSEEISRLLHDGARSSAKLALRFVMTNTNVTCTLSGMGSMAMVEENLLTASDESPLSDEEIATIDVVREQSKRFAELYCTGCSYCMPCPQEVNIPLNFKIMNYHRVYGLTDYAKGEYEKIGKAGGMVGKKADECAECGLCEEKCPQKLKIRELLKETSGVLGK